MPIFVLIRKPWTLPLWANNLILSASWPAPSQCSTVLSSTRLKDTTMANYIAHYMQQQHALQRGYPNDTPFIADCTLCTMLRGYHNSTLYLAWYTPRIPQCHTIQHTTCSMLCNEDTPMPHHLQQIAHYAHYEDTTMQKYRMQHCVCERHISGSHCIHAHCTQYPLYHSTSCQQVAHYKSVS